MLSNLLKVDYISKIILFWVILIYMLFNASILFSYAVSKHLKKHIYT